MGMQIAYYPANLPWNSFEKVPASVKLCLSQLGRDIERKSNVVAGVETVPESGNGKSQQTFSLGTLAESNPLIDVVSEPASHLEVPVITEFCSVCAKLTHPVIATHNFVKTNAAIFVFPVVGET